MTNNVTIIKVDICININMNIEIDYSFKSKIDELSHLQIAINNPQFKLNQI